MSLDGFHTHEELYEHRNALIIALVREKKGWRSKFHSDGTMDKGWFIVGINKLPGYQITYHLPLSKWRLLDEIETLGKAPLWDKHTSEEVLERLCFYKNYENISLIQFNKPSTEDVLCFLHFQKTYKGSLFVKEAWIYILSHSTLAAYLFKNKKDRLEWEKSLPENLKKMLKPSLIHEILNYGWMED